MPPTPLTAVDVRRALGAVGPASPAAPSGPPGPRGSDPPAPPVLATPEAAAAPRPSAVLVALFEGPDGDLRVVLTRRSPALTRHSGQVSFPGGRVEPGESLIEAALREAEEEVGLPRNDVDVVGRLSPVPTVVSGLVVHPFVGLVPAALRLVPDPGEVEYVFDVGLGELLAAGVHREELWPGPEGERSVFFFEVAGETVWGVTAAVLTELLTLVVSAPRRPAEEFC